MAQSIADRIELIRGDITQLSVDAIVNAANSSLLGGGGVDGAIHRAAGPELLAECKTLGGCATGSAKITAGYNLPARFVIHAVGPVYHDGQSGEPEKLADCYQSALALASNHGCTSIAFPAISCGIYGYPMADAAKIAIHEVLNYLEANPQSEANSPITRVVFVLFDDRGLQTYRQVFKQTLNERRVNLT